MTPLEPEAHPSTTPCPKTARVQKKRQRKRVTKVANFSEKYRQLMEVTRKGGAGPCIHGNGPAKPPHPDSFAVMYRTWMEVMNRSVERAKLGQATAAADGEPRAKMADTPPVKMETGQANLKAEMWDTTSSTVQEMPSEAKHQMPVSQNSPGEPLFLFYPELTPVHPQDPKPSLSVGQGWDLPSGSNFHA